MKTLANENVEPHMVSIYTVGKYTNKSHVSLVQTFSQFNTHSIHRDKYTHYNLTFSLTSSSSEHNDVLQEV